MSEILTLTHATERDVDLLIVEELSCSPTFVRWLVDIVGHRVGKQIGFQTTLVTHSSRRMFNRREIDICLTLNLRNAKPVMLLIENKLDASDQPAQAESYQDEAKTLCAEGTATDVFTVLICPQEYSVSNATFSGKFDATVTYEQVAEYLDRRSRQERGESADRLAYRHRLIRQAIEKWRRGYEAVPLPAIAAFNKQYVELCKQYAPSLKPGPSMIKDGRPCESKTMIFHPDTLPSWDFLPQVRIVHQLREGNANINFYGWGDHFTELAAVVAADLKGTPYRPVPTVNKRKEGKSGLMIVAMTPSINNTDAFENQRSAIIDGIRVTNELRSWMWKNKAAIERWATIVSG